MDVDPRLRRGLRKRAPAAADLEHAIARRGGGAIEDRGKLGALRLLEWLVRRGEARTRIGHAGVEPQRVELVDQIVLLVDVAPRAGAVVAVRAMPGPTKPPPHALRTARVGQCVAFEREQFEQRDRVWTFPFARRPRFVPSGRSAGGEPPQCAPAMQDDARLGPRSTSAKPRGHIARKRNSARAAPDPAIDAAKHPLPDPGQRSAKAALPPSLCRRIHAAIHAPAPCRRPAIWLATLQASDHVRLLLDHPGLALTQQL